MRIDGPSPGVRGRRPSWPASDDQQRERARNDADLMAPALDAYELWSLTIQWDRKR
jgi:hypothetical protein